MYGSLFGVGEFKYAIRIFQGAKGVAVATKFWQKLENVEIANALQLDAARRRTVPIRFNFVARAKFEVAQPIRCCLRAFLCASNFVRSHLAIDICLTVRLSVCLSVCLSNACTLTKRNTRM